MTDRRLILGTSPNGPITLDQSQVSRHMFVCGSTGSGKTSLLLSMVANALSWGSGCMFVDGKGDRDALAGVSTLATRFGREDDLLVLDLSDARGGHASNTMNPFARTGAPAMTNMIISMMDDAGGDGIFWKGRAIAMLGPIMKALAFQRDHEGMDIEVTSIREAMNLRRIIDFADEQKTPTIPARIRDQIKAYLTSLPGFQPEKGYKQAQTTLDQHGYLEMQYTRLLGAMSDDFAGIFSVKAGDIDLRDVLLNRRILVVLLPMGGQSAEQAAFMGNVILCMLKDLMGAVAAGAVPRESGAPPFMVFLDEFGQYTLPGAETIVAQGRSLGMSFTFATQSLTPSARDVDGNVLKHVLSNTATKILMRTDALDDTALAAIAPSDRNLDMRITDLRSQLAHTAALASLPGMAEGKCGASERYGSLLAEHDALVKTRANSGLSRMLPGMKPGEMLVLNGGGVRSGTAYDMSGLYGEAPPPPSGVPLTRQTRHRLRKAGFNALETWTPTAVVPIPVGIREMFPQASDRVDALDATKRAVASCYLADQEIEGVES